MSTKLAKETSRLDQAEWALAEVAEASEALKSLGQNLLRHKLGSEPYLETLAQIAVAAETLKAKLITLLSAIDAAEDDLPDQDRLTPLPKHPEAGFPLQTLFRIHAFLMMLARMLASSF